MDEKTQMLFDTLIFEIRKMASDMNDLADKLRRETKNAKRRVYKDGQLVKEYDIPTIKLACEERPGFDDHLINNRGERTQ
jgi:hypothetical protein